MAGLAGAPIVVTGMGRILPADGSPTPMRAELGEADFTIMVEGAQPFTASYRDLTTVAVDQVRVLLHFGDVRLIAEQLGAGLGTLLRELRERRTRQMLTDRLIDLPDGERLELVEYSAGAGAAGSEEHGTALLAFHAWGFALAPLDERSDWRLARRADISRVEADQAHGRVVVDEITLHGLGLDTVRHAARFTALRDDASADAAAIVNRLLPDAPAAARGRAASLLIDGRPVSVHELGDAASFVEPAMLTDPTYAATYSALVQRASTGGGNDTRRWLALAPRRPTDPTEHISWFLVGLPGGLLAMELVSEGAHATYLFRARDSFDAAVRDVSESLIDTRFLREPIYLTEEELGAPGYLRYRLAIAALPSLRAARARFVRRLIHTDEASWSAALDEAINSEGA